jgi:hypothetical protein
VTLSNVKKLVFGIGLIAIPLSNATLAYSYTGRVIDSILAGAWAAVPMLVLYWWAAVKSHSKAERLLVFSCVSISVAFGVALFVGRVWNGLEIEPVTNMFPVAAPLLLFALEFVLMLLVTCADFAVSAFNKQSNT